MIPFGQAAVKRGRLEGVEGAEGRGEARAGHDRLLSAWALHTRRFIGRFPQAEIAVIRGRARPV
ncbi:hypothetical protein D3C73_1615930 [compost metagenome]